MTPSALQVGPDGKLRVRDGKLVLGNPGDSCCCACKACDYTGNWTLTLTGFTWCGCTAYAVAGDANPNYYSVTAGTMNGVLCLPKKAIFTNPCRWRLSFNDGNIPVIPITLTLYGHDATCTTAVATSHRNLDTIEFILNPTSGLLTVDAIIGPGPGGLGWPDYSGSYVFSTSLTASDKGCGNSYTFTVSNECPPFAFAGGTGMVSGGTAVLTRGLLMGLGENIAVCVACDRRGQSPAGECHGACACTIDGLPIASHASAGTCPLGKFAASGGASPPPQPATAVAWASHGPALWAELHRRALSPAGLAPAWLDDFAARIPCGECRRHWLALVEQSPPPADAFAWSVEAHNAVNRRLGRPEIAVADAQARWIGE